MRASRKLLAVIAAVTLSATACGGSGGDSAGAAGASASGGSGSSAQAGGKLTVWIMDGTSANQDEMFAAVNKDFEAQHPGTKVDVQFIPWTAAHQKFVTSVAGGSGPDVAEMGTTWTPEFAATGALADLTDKVNGWDGAKDQIPGLMDSVTYDGKKYGIGWYAGVRSLLYRKDMFDKAGVQPPKTWDDLVSAATKVQQANPGVMGFAVPGSDQYALYPFIWGAGGKVATKDGDSWKATIDSPEAQKGVAFYTGLMTEHHLSPASTATWNAKDQVSNFQLGKVASMIAGQWEVATILKGAPDLKGKLGSTLIPVMNAGDTSKSFAGGSDLVVFKNSKQQDLAWDYLKMMGSDKYEKMWAQQTGFFPSSQTLLDSPEYQNDPVMKAFADQMKTAVNLPTSPKWGAVQGAQVIESMTQAILTGKQSVADATKAAAQQIDSSLNG